MLIQGIHLDTKGFKVWSQETIYLELHFVHGTLEKLRGIHLFQQASYLRMKQRSPEKGYSTTTTAMNGELRIPIAQENVDSSPDSPLMYGLEL